MRWTEAVAGPRVNDEHRHFVFPTCGGLQADHEFGVSAGLHQSVSEQFQPVMEQHEDVRAAMKRKRLTANPDRDERAYRLVR